MAGFNGRAPSQVHHGRSWLVPWSGPSEKHLGVASLLDLALLSGLYEAAPATRPSAAESDDNDQAEFLGEEAKGPSNVNELLIHQLARRMGTKRPITTMSQRSRRRRMTSQRIHLGAAPIQIPSSDREPLRRKQHFCRAGVSAQSHSGHAVGIFVANPTLLRIFPCCKQ